jgi:LDH2 family malate/lactate/ureidoglycolate dehydrogenase
MVGIALTNAPSNMPPAGGRSKFFGTNPVTIGVPYRNGFPVMLDMSTSVVARGKIAIAQREGKSIPDGWAVDAQGHPTNDPEAALTGSVLPMAGYKGAGLALMIDVLSGVLSGAAYGSHIVDLYNMGTEHQDVGHFLLALNVEHFMPLADFTSRMEGFVDEVRSQPRIPGVDRIFMPGEIEYETASESATLGIRVSTSGLSDLADLARKVGVKPLLIDCS